MKKTTLIFSRRAVKKNERKRTMQPIAVSPFTAPQHAPIPNFASDFVWEIDRDGGVAIVEFLNKNATAVVVPSEIGGRPVTAIGSRRVVVEGKNGEKTEKYVGAFEGCVFLRSATPPENLREIGRNAFAGCASLTTFIFPENLREIGRNAFAGCSSLTTLAFPEELLEIGENAFAGCVSLRSATFLRGPANDADADGWRGRFCRFFLGACENFLGRNVGERARFFSRVDGGCVCR